MYKWREMTPKERQEALRFRREQKRPWHSPPHWDSEISLHYIVSAACYEHRHIPGKVPCRIAQLEDALINICDSYCLECVAWCILPNHYHILIKTDQMKELRQHLGLMHGRLSRQWNLEDDKVPCS